MTTFKSEIIIKCSKCKCDMNCQSISANSICGACIEWDQSVKDCEAEQMIKPYDSMFGTVFTCGIS